MESISDVRKSGNIPNILRKRSSYLAAPEENGNFASIEDLDNEAYDEDVESSEDEESASIEDLDNEAYDEDVESSEDEENVSIEDLDNEAYDEDAESSEGEENVSIEDLDNEAYDEDVESSEDEESASIEEFDNEAYDEETEVSQTKQEEFKLKVCRSEPEGAQANKLGTIPVVRGSGQEGTSKAGILPKTNSENGEVTEELEFQFAKKLLKKYRICYLTPLDSILWIYNGMCYRPLPQKELETLIYQELSEEYKEQNRSCNSFIRNVSNYLTRECASPVITEGLAPQKTYTGFTEADYRLTFGKVVLENGVYDVVEGKLGDFTPDIPFHYRLNARFIENSRYETMETKYFDKLLRDASRDEDTVRMTMQVLGMLLLSNRSKKFPVVGPASNSGKSVLFGSWLERVLGEERISRVSTSELGGRFAFGNAEDKVLFSCMDADIETISAKAAGNIKRATGEEHMKSEAKCQNHFEIFIRFKFVFGTNGNFSPMKYDTGWNNRIIAVPFLFETPEEDQIPDLPEKLWAERDAIVTKVLKAVGEAITEDGHILIKESALSLQLKNEWTTANTYFSEFYNEGIVITGSSDDYASRDEIYHHYQIFCLRKNTLLGGNGKYCKLTKTQLVTKLLQSSGGNIWDERKRQFGEEKFDNAVRRICGLKLLN